MQNLIKLAVGAKEIGDLHRWQSERLFAYEGRQANCIWTKRKPTQSDAIIADGGSLYWVVKGRIACRQVIWGFESHLEGTADSNWQIILDPQIIRTIAVPRKAFQGWRYLTGAQAPADRGVFDPEKADEEDEMPAEMAAALRELGLM